MTRNPQSMKRVAALLEVVLCSGLPTQVVIGSGLAAAGFGSDDGALTLPFVVWVSLLDTIVLVGLIVFFLRSAHEEPRQLFFGSRPVSGEAIAGIPLAVLSLSLALTVLVMIRTLAPSLHTFERNPLQDLMHSPRDTALFALVVVIAGGVREEIQRAFVVTRFEQFLGGPRVGVVVASAVFGALHLLQGVDAAIATGLLGALWAVAYLGRRSIVAPVVSHSLFNLVQLAQFWLLS